MSMVTWVEKNNENFSSIPYLQNIFYGFAEKGSMCLILVGFSKKISYSTTLEAINVWPLLGFYKQSYAYNHTWAMGVGLPP